MKPSSIAVIPTVAMICVGVLPQVAGQEQPNVVWEVRTPSGLANSIQGVGWSPTTSARVAVGSTDRWVRTRQASNGALVYSVLQPHRSGNADQTLYSNDGLYLAVHNSSGGLGYRVHRAADGVFLGILTATIGADRLVRFAPDSQLIGAVGGDGTLSRWRVADFTIVETVGSGYQRTTTVFNFSPNGAYQSAASGGFLTIRRTNDGATVRVVAGGVTKGVTPVAFAPNGASIAAWSPSPNQTTLWQISDGIILMRFPNAASDEGIGSIRFTPDGSRLVTTGYRPYLDSYGLWQQVGMIRFWRVADGALRHSYSIRTGIAVTSPVAWSPDASRFAYGTYDGTAVAALTPGP
jgi:WD40 repeat protein